MIRRFRSTDLETVLSIWRRASELAHSFLSPEFLDQEAVTVRDVHLPNAETSIYEEDGALLGFIALIGNEVGAIFVDPEYSRRGVGKALMDHAAGLHSMLELDVFEKNQIGRSFYERYGFVEVGRSVHEETGERMLRLRYG